MIYYFCLFLVLIPFMILIPIKVKGRKNIPAKGRMILVCNHQSNWDALIIGTKLLRRRFWFMSKAELFKNKFSSAFFKVIGMYPVNRNKNDIKAVKKTLTLLNNEKAICIFPEGTRLQADEVENLKNGTALFALKTKSTIVPSYFVSKPKIFRMTTYLIGEPFNLSEMDEFKDKPLTKDVLNRASEVVSERMNKLKEKYLEKHNKKKK